MTRLYFDRALLQDGWRDQVTVTVSGDGQIVGVESGTAPSADTDRVKGVALPGVGNLHSHTFQRGFAGLTERRGVEDDHFWTWREAMYNFVGHLVPEDVEAVAAMAFVEMIESGFTAVAEFHYLHHGAEGQPYGDPAELSRRIVAAAATTGIGLTLLPVFYAHSGFDGGPPTPGQRRFVCDLDLFARLHASAGDAVSTLPIGGIGIAPHSLRAVTMEELTYLLGLHGSGAVHIHIAEQEREIAECLAVTGERPVDWLLSHIAIDRRWCLVHATHMTEDETRRFGRTGAVAGLCPITESNLGDGIFPLTSFLRADGRYGVGSDSNVQISLRDELRTLCYSQRLRDRARNRVATPHRSSGRVLFEAAAAAGAQALSLPIGAIAPGARADIIVLDPDDPTLVGRDGDTVLDAWIFASTHSPVSEVYLGGRRVVERGRHIGRAAVEAAFRRVMHRLRAI
ncbi:formimidoylglutamate deiminase [Lichenifustis flavocetrariae]|uniref:Formimidoylglutamate deiminase n=1 Tax=Lichenifustis flavocetrariae TaxID=2949735 RepID=A0AA41YSV8_9HYPH|nr:formimidoylglutamate deiminase [Lichenifustis flavocetrariae]MCW6507979.1 formimidoylglutamate deiminase [Lichenifustis flavocetrariae]